MALSVIAVVTDTARQKLADMLISGKSFQVTHFTTGNGGHDPGNPTIALTPDPTVIELPSRTFGPKVLNDAQLISAFCPRFEGILENTEAVGELSNVGLIATMIYSPIPADPVIGTQFLFAVGNFPLKVKTDTDELTIRITLQF